jgi:hypothetical protein
MWLPHCRATLSAIDADAFEEWTRLEDEYDTQVDRFLASTPGGSASGQSLDLARERLADLRRRRDAAREKYVDNLKDSPGPDPRTAAPDRASIVILGSD